MVVGLGALGLVTSVQRNLDVTRVNAILSIFSISLSSDANLANESAVRSLARY